jgi:hypothetical protein
MEDIFIHIDKEGPNPENVNYRVWFEGADHLEGNWDDAIRYFDSKEEAIAYAVAVKTMIVKSYIIIAADPQATVGMTGNVPRYTT